MKYSYTLSCPDSQQVSVKTIDLDAHFVVTGDHTIRQQQYNCARFLFDWTLNRRWHWCGGPHCLHCLSPLVCRLIFQRHFCKEWQPRHRVMFVRWTFLQCTRKTFSAPNPYLCRIKTKKRKNNLQAVLLCPHSIL